jgi:quercetin dioxygenase-like cupin family protein
LNDVAPENSGTGSSPFSAIQNRRRDTMMKVEQIVRSDLRTAVHLPGGTIIEPLSPSTEGAYHVMTGAIPPGVSVPLHSHGDAESFYLISGEAEVIVETTDGLQWQTLRPGDFIHTPGGAKHAWRNRSDKTAFSLVVCTPRLGQALEEMGQAIIGAQSRSPEALQRLVEVGQRYGYWFGSPEENAAVGIELP